MKKIDDFVQWGALKLFKENIYDPKYVPKVDTKEKTIGNFAQWLIKNERVPPESQDGEYLDYL